jgi:hypothetical protein
MITNTKAFNKTYNRTTVLMQATKEKKKRKHTINCHLKDVAPVLI